MRAPTCSTERTLFPSSRPCLLSSDANISARLMGVGVPRIWWFANGPPRTQHAEQNQTRAKVHGEKLRDMGHAFPEPWPVGSDRTCPTPQPGAATTCGMCRPPGSSSEVSTQGIYQGRVTWAPTAWCVPTFQIPRKMGCSAQAIVFVQFMPSETLLAHGCKPFPNPHS